jgi:hypothetical protein
MDAAKLYVGRAWLPCGRLTPAGFVDAHNRQKTLDGILGGKGVNSWLGIKRKWLGLIQEARHNGSEVITILKELNHFHSISRSEASTC